MFVFLLIFGVVLVQSLDFVVFEAHKYGPRLILSLKNNYENFGGKAQYVQWARNAGQNINFVDDFFTNPTVKGYYKNYVKVTNSINLCFCFIICLILFRYVYRCDIEIHRPICMQYIYIHDLFKSALGNAFSWRLY